MGNLEIAEQRIEKSMSTPWNPLDLANLGLTTEELVQILLLLQEKLPNLKRLNLENNLLTSLPNSIGNHSSLRILELRNNELTSLPESIGNLSSLRILELRSNNLTSLPEGIGNLSYLTYLNLKNNNITSLPESIGNLSNLKYLDLNDSNLTGLPQSIKNLSNLRILELKKNPLSLRSLLQISLINHLSNKLDLNQEHRLMIAKISGRPEFLNIATSITDTYPNISVEKFNSLFLNFGYQPNT